MKERQHKREKERLNGVNQKKYEEVIQLWDLHGPMPISDLADASGSSRKTVTKYLKLAGYYDQVPWISKRIEAGNHKEEEEKGKSQFYDVDESVFVGRKDKFIERAEQISREQLNSLDLIEPRNVLMIENYILDGFERAFTLMAPKGTGKTITVMKALSNIIQSTDLVPSMILFKAQRRPYLLSPLKLASPEEYGEALPKLTGAKTFQEVLDVSDIVVLDDLHYMFEAVAEGVFSETQVDQVLFWLSDQVNQGKRVIILTEDMLNYYIHKLNLPSLMKYARFLGFTPLKDQPDTLSSPIDPKTPLDLINQNHYAELIPLTREGYKRLDNLYGINIEDECTGLLMSMGMRPRAYLKFCNLFEGNHISFTRVRRFVDQVIMSDINKLKQEGDWPSVIKQVRSLESLRSRLKFRWYNADITPSQILKFRRLDTWHWVRKRGTMAEAVRHLEEWMLSEYEKSRGHMDKNMEKRLMGNYSSPLFYWAREHLDYKKKIRAFEYPRTVTYYAPLALRYYVEDYSFRSNLETYLDNYNELKWLEDRALRNMSFLTDNNYGLDLEPYHYALEFYIREPSTREILDLLNGGGVN